MPIKGESGIVISQLRADRDRLQENIKALGEDMRKCQKLITDEEVLIGFNMAVALCNKHLAESEDKE
jgi:chromosome condensin MukBEF ATPase and DNA-binding subunit MukB